MAAVSPGWTRPWLEPGSAQCPEPWVDGSTSPNSFLPQWLWITTVSGHLWGGEKSDSLFAAPWDSCLCGEQSWS